MNHVLESADRLTGALRGASLVIKGVVLPMVAIILTGLGYLILEFVQVRDGQIRMESKINVIMSEVISNATRIEAVESNVGDRWRKADQTLFMDGPFSRLADRVRGVELTGERHTSEIRFIKEQIDRRAPE